MRTTVFLLAAVTAFGCSRDAVTPQGNGGGGSGGDAVSCDAPEACNGIDDDCDGTVDENAMGVGRPCSEGVGACRQEGTMGCFGGEFVCSVTGIAPTAETCDAADNDCDGSTDEDFTLATDAANCGACGTVCRFPNAEAECIRGECALSACMPGFHDLDGGPGCEYACTVTNDGTEICDGQDNDCDGTADEGFDFQSDAAHCGRCNVMCSAPNATLVCDQGLCILQQCAEGFYDGDFDTDTGCEAACRADEACDGVDDDCDGLVDEIRDVDPLNCGECGRVCDIPNAESTCNGGQCSILRCPENHFDLDANPANGCEHICFPQDSGMEICDSLDNDCDGSTDEGFNFESDLQNCGMCGLSCERDDSDAICANRLCQIGDCVDGRVDLDGDPENGCECEIRVEDCNNRDDDCDGTTDENLEVSACGSPVGICEQGVRSCNQGEWELCVGDNGPALSETCNQLDDDCDGAVDENIPQAPCDTGVPGECAASQASCVNGELICEAVAPLPEVCDGLDNDCNGEIDDGMPNVECMTGIPGKCALGLFMCVEGGVECVAPPPSQERCDSLDNDCDGEVDEGRFEGRCCTADLADESPPCNDAEPGTFVPDGMAYIRPGEFRMGEDAMRLDEVAPFLENAHPVQLTRAFLIDIHEVSFTEWQTIYPDTRLVSDCHATADAPCPVRGITWFDAVHYANSRSRDEGLEQCYGLAQCMGRAGSGLVCNNAVDWDRGLDCTGYRLPTEAEWEYATRAQSGTYYFFGEDPEELVNVAWYGPNAIDGDGNPAPQSVGLLRPNTWGLHDVHGNVSEWVFDYITLYPEDLQIDPIADAPFGGNFLRVLRSGNYADEDAFALRSAARDNEDPAEPIPTAGVRLVRTVPTPERGN